MKPKIILKLKIIYDLARVSHFILEVKHKTLNVKRTWVELEILQKNKSAQDSINQI